MKAKRSHVYGRQYEAVEQAIEGEDTSPSFTFNLIFFGAVIVSFFELFWSFSMRRHNIFVWTSLLIDFSYPFMMILKSKKYSLTSMLCEGTLLPGWMYGCWCLCYPHHRVYVYYVPMLLSSLGKVYHLMGGDSSKDVDDMVQSLSKFQSKIDVLILLFTFFSLFVKLKFSWFKLVKIGLLMLILKLKYCFHYGTQLSWNQIHHNLDQVSRYILIRPYYQLFYFYFSKIGNDWNKNKVIIL